jgi:membrane protease YdiL (CAAX protease family)
MATVTTRDAPLRPMGILSSMAVFGAFSLVLWLVLAVLIPWLHNTFGIPPIIGWYVSGTAFVLLPILLFGVVQAWRELPTRNLGQLCKRLRLNWMSGRDIVWAICGLVGIALASAIVLALARDVDPVFRASPEFLRQPPGWHAWVFLAWIPLFICNILGEELCWRGYVLPRQEAAWGRAGWLPNGAMWCLFHWSFGWSVMLLLLPIALLLPWIVQRRRNTSVGIVIHAIFNAAGFIAAVSGRANL